VLISDRRPLKPLSSNLLFPLSPRCHFERSEAESRNLPPLRYSPHLRAAGTPLSAVPPQISNFFPQISYPPLVLRTTFPPLRGGTIKPTHMSFRAQRSGVEKSPTFMWLAVSREYVSRYHASLTSDSLTISLSRGQRTADSG
jgi:hypothetical protein